MPLILADRVRDTTTTTGTGTVTLSGTAPTGYQNFSVIGNGNTTYYTINAGSQWEVGIGTYSSTGPTLARNTVLESSNANALVNFAAGVKDVFVTYPSDKSVNYDESNNVGIGTTTPATRLDVNGVTTFRGSTNQTSGAHFTSNGEGLWMSGFASYGAGITSDAAGTAVRLWTSGSERMRVTTAGDVGIGTSSPTQLLTLAAANNFPFIHWNNASNTTIAFAGWHGGAGGGDDFRMGTNSTRAVTFHTNSTERMRLSAAGGLSVGTSVDPGAGNIIAQGSAASTSVNSPTGTQLLRHNGSFDAGAFGASLNFTQRWWSGDAGFISVGQIAGVKEGSNGSFGGGLALFVAPSGSNTMSEAMRLSMSGNAGIGTTAPAARLHASIGSSGNTLPTNMQGIFESFGNNGIAVSAPATDTGGLYFPRSTVAYYAGVERVNTALVFRNNDSERARIDSSGNLLVGATSIFSSVANYRYVQVSGGLGGIVDLGNTTASYGRVSADINGLNVESLGATYTSFRTNNAERMRIDASGNMSLGNSAIPYTTAGRTVFSVNGSSSALIGLQSAGANRGYLYGDGAVIALEAESPCILKLNVIGAQPMTFFTSNTQRMSIGSDGVVTANVDIRAPIYYDSNNTAFYLDAASNSVLNTLTLASGSVLGSEAIFNNMNQPHTTYGDANNVGFGFRYLQSGSNYPGIPSATQYYGMTLGLGSDYAFSSFASQFYWPRTPLGGLPYPSVRFRESGTWGSWSKIYAGWADAPSGATFAATGDFRAPIFYDSNNTAFFVDPASTSNLTGLTVANTISGSVNGSAGFVAGTNLGKTGPQGFFTTSSWTPANWANLAIGGGGMTIFNTPGQPAGNNFGFFIKTGNRDAGNGWGGIWQDYDGGSLYYGATVDGTAFATWRKTVAYGVNSSGTVFASDFYDSDNTAYFANPAGTSEFATIQTRGGNGFRSFATPASTIVSQLYFANAGNTQAWNWQLDEGNNGALWNFNGSAWIKRAAFRADGLVIGPNGSGEFTRFGGGAGDTSIATVAATNGNLHIDSKAGFDLYLNWYTARPVWSEGGAYFPIYYDRNNSAFFVDPASGSRLGGQVTFNGGTNVASNGDVYARRDGGSGGVYYFADGGSKFLYWDGSQYYFGGSFTINGHIFQAGQDMRAPIYYDSNNTGFYIDSNETSRTRRMGANYFQNNDGITANTPFGLYFASDLSSAYAIFREAGAWDFPFPDLRIAFHTGIKLGANASYQGVRFYTDFDMVTQVMSVNNANDGVGAGHVFVNNVLQAGGDLRAPIFYDSNNTGFYLDPTGFSFLGSVSLGPQTWRNDITWNSGVNVNVPASAECSFDVNSGGTWQVWDLTSGAPFIKCTAGTNVEIGQAGSRGLYVFGAITASGNVTAFSDIRVKDNVEQIEGALDRVSRIRGVTYTRTDLDDKERRYGGVIAQEIEAVLPEAIFESGDRKAVDYNATIGLLIEAIKELRAEVAELKGK